jgi:hypothetical protein
VFAQKPTAANASGATASQLVLRPYRDAQLAVKSRSGKIGIGAASSLVDAAYSARIVGITGQSFENYDLLLAPSKTTIYYCCVYSQFYVRRIYRGGHVAGVKAGARKARERGESSSPE